MEAKAVLFWVALPLLKKLTASVSRFRIPWKRKLKEEAVEAVKFLWKRKHFEKKSWKRKQTRKRQLYTELEAEAKYSTASTSLF